MRRRTYIRQDYVVCSGRCGMYVPRHVSPDNCRYCVSLPSCTSCGITFSSKRRGLICDNCHRVEFPVRACETCHTSFTTRKSSLQTSCPPCVTRMNKTAFVESLGAINDRYAIRVKIIGSITSHSGYCSDHDDSAVRTSKSKEFVYFPAPALIVSSYSELEKLMERFDCADFALHTDICCRRSENDYKLHSYELVSKTPHMDLQSLEALY